MTHDERRYVAGLGEILWDLLPDGKQLGGAPANFAYHAQTLGARAEVLSCVGDDALGREILERLDAWSVGRRYVALDPEHPTGTVSVTLEAGGIPRYVIHERVAWDYIPWTPEMERLAGAVDAVCFGSLCQRGEVSRRTIRSFLESTRSGALRVCDINLRPSGPDEGIVCDSLRLANVLKLNDAELPFLAAMLGLEGSDREVLAKMAERFDLRVIALTRGPHGSLLVSAEGASDHPGFAAEVVDTIGAGDAFTAALVIGLLNGDTLDAINDRANRIAAAVCSHRGAIP